ncbi:MAG: glycerol-3-phosphate dehydrogenase [Myxococcales bacterium]
MRHVQSTSAIEKTTNSNVYDLFVIGGGINGTGIALDASGRGLSVALCEQADLASATSSASSKLIHGGLRYLEHYEFRLVREALAEREVLLSTAPHLIKPLRFILPHRPHLRPAWMIRIGLFMYDHLSSRNKLAGSAGRKLDPAARDNPLSESIGRGFEYSDCQVDDARLVVSNALGAQERGARIMVRTRCIGATRENGLWRIELEELLTGRRFEVFARGLVNAAGPWAQKLVEQQMKTKSPRTVRLIKGSHFVTRKVYEGDQAYILQNEDQRIVFVIPYNRDFTLVGTTDKVYEGDPAQVAMDAEEEQYLLDVYNRHFKRQLGREDILWRYSGVRPLCDDESASPSAMTRDYTLEVGVDEQGELPVLHVFGGKLTTYRRLAEAALHALQPYFPHMTGSWTRTGTLPGGDIGGDDFGDWLTSLKRQYGWLPDDLAARLGNAYGTRVHALLQGCHALADLGKHFGAGLYQREVEFLLEQEWARSAEDVLWRRSKLGLRVSAEDIQALDRFVREKLAAPLSSPSRVADDQASVMQRGESWIPPTHPTHAA